MEEKFKLDMAKRPRRLRKGASMLSLCAENRLDPADMILPVFIMEGKSGSAKIPSMPGVFRHTVDSLLKLCEKSLKCGVRAIAPFPLVEASLKSPRADEAVNPKSLANRAIAAVKKRFPEMIVAADIALDPYTSHGHDGILDPSGSWILNDETVEILAGMSALAAQAGEVLSRTALSHVEAGADMVAPSDMMDGRIGAIRATLDECDFPETAIMAYSAKYASAYYGPFRDAIGSAPKSANGAKKKYLDKRGYQLNPANSSEALREAALDEEEGADVIMVKPAGSYLDIVAKIKTRTNLPVAAYQVSGEYSMIQAAAQKGWIDLARAREESVLSIKRAGADIILTYFALDLANAFGE